MTSKENQQLTTIVKQVAKQLTGYELDDSFKDDVGNWRAGLRGPDGARIVFDLTWKRGRLSIHATVPGDLVDVRRLLDSLPRITVAPGADPAHIAAEIERCLLPGYVPKLAAARRAAAEFSAERTACQVAMAELAQLTGDPAVVGWRMDFDRPEFYAWGGATGGSVHVMGQPSNDGPSFAAKLERLTLYEASALLATLRQLRSSVPPPPADQLCQHAVTVTPPPPAPDDSPESETERRRR
jgi:hypothetical protein